MFELFEFLSYWVYNFSTSSILMYALGSQRTLLFLFIPLIFFLVLSFFLSIVFPGLWLWLSHWILSFELCCWPSGLVHTFSSQSTLLFLFVPLFFSNLKFFLAMIITKLLVKRNSWGFFQGERGWRLLRHQEKNLQDFLSFISLVEKWYSFQVSPPNMPFKYPHSICLSSIPT